MRGVENGYKDRGKMKWLGLMLSDHSEALVKMAEDGKEYEVKAKPKQSLAEIGEILTEAYHMKKPVVIQAYILQNGSYFKDVPCLISGVSEEKMKKTCPKIRCTFFSIYLNVSLIFMTNHILFIQNISYSNRYNHRSE